MFLIRRQAHRLHSKQHLWHLPFCDRLITAGSAQRHKDCSEAGPGAYGKQCNRFWYLSVVWKLMRRPIGKIKAIHQGTQNVTAFAVLETGKGAAYIHCILNLSRTRMVRQGCIVAWEGLQILSFCHIPP